MAHPPSKKLIDLGGAVSDGSSVDWDVELRNSPDLASQLKRLQQLEAIGNVHRSLPAPDRSMPITTQLSVREDGPVRCPFRWGHLNVLEQIGRGSFGEVYRAIDSRLLREVALKLRRIESSAKGSSARRFLAEARGLARVRHQNVVVVYGADVHGGRVGFWTDFIHGQTLAARLANEGPLGAEGAILVGVDLCRALAAVHAAGLVHGDVKAANAMREESGRIVLMDFGASSAWFAGQGGVPGGEAVIGTPLIVAPEVLRGEAPHPASDLYSLAVLLHQLVSGRYPFEAENLTELREKHEAGVRMPLGELRPELPPAFVQVVERALNSDPHMRHQNASEMESALLAAMGSPAGKRHTLPGEPDILIGREAELATLGLEIESGSRLVTLLGPGGMGKTRLAVRYGWRDLDKWPGGVWFCDLTDARGFDGMVSAVAAGLDVSLGKEDPVEQLGHAIAGRGRCLVILDNLEQVVDLARATIRPWLAHATEARFVVTSRESVNVPGESLLIVEPLSIESGIELFLERVRRRGAGIKLEGSVAESVREVVRLVEGIPLAIELAAGRVQVMTPAQIVERMRDRFRVLAGGVVAGGRHATLKAAIDSSWELLRPWEKAAFAQCSVFQGGFTLEAVEEVLDLGPWPEAPWVVDVVQTLVDKSLLRGSDSERSSMSGTAAREPRFGMLLSLQEYARAKLNEGEALAAEERHGRWCARLGSAEAMASLDCAGGLDRRVLALEIENIIAACRRAVARGDGTAAAATYRAAWAVLELRGPFATAIELGKEVLGAGLAPGDRAQTLETLGNSSIPTGQTIEARSHLEAALGIYRELGDRQGEATTLACLGNLDAERETEEARAHYNAALAIHREVGSRRDEAIDLTNLGRLHLFQGRMEEARALYDVSLAIHREVGNRVAEGFDLFRLGYVGFYQSRFEDAQANLEAALAIARETGDRPLESRTHSMLGTLPSSPQRMDQARAHLETALAISRQIGSRRDEASVLANMGFMHFKQGRMFESRVNTEAALAIHREMGSRLGEAIALGNLGVLHYNQGHMEEARAHYEGALASWCVLGNRRIEGEMLGHLGRLDFVEHRLGEARVHCEAALVIHRELANRGHESTTLTTLGLIFLGAGQMAEAQTFLEAALAIVRGLGEPREEGLLLGHLGRLRLAEGRLSEASAMVSEGEALLRGSAPSIELGRLLCVGAELEHRSGDVVAARRVLAEAEELAARMGTGPDSELGIELASASRMILGVGAAI